MEESTPPAPPAPEMTRSEPTREDLERLADELERVGYRRSAKTLRAELAGELELEPLPNVIVDVPEQRRGLTIDVADRASVTELVDAAEGPVIIDIDFGELAWCPETNMMSYGGRAHVIYRRRDANTIESYRFEG